jgi:GNAT superfamily N-acetyltransferase
MKISVKKLSFPLLPEFEYRPIDVSQAPLLGELMDSSYRNSIDHEGETLDQCVDEIRQTICGKYGPFIGEASFAVYSRNRPVSAILITEWKGHPLVAYTMTEVGFQGKGLAKYLLGESVSSLRNSKWKELFLVVTEGNSSAENLYTKVGFKRAGQAFPGTPPPVDGL